MIKILEIFCCFFHPCYFSFTDIYAMAALGGQNEQLLKIQNFFDFTDIQEILFCVLYKTCKMAQETKYVWS